MTKNKIIISTDKSPKAIGPYSQAIGVKMDSNIIYTSGQIPLNPKTGKLISDDFGEQVMQTLDNIRGILENRNCSLNNIIKLTVYMIDLSNFDQLNTIFQNYWEKAELSDYPARSALEVSRLPKNSQVEIEAVFYDEN
tara:strand:- start:262 stop:675 length:414 start_codon:yes stop_codon:yes gene_type:complete